MGKNSSAVRRAFFDRRFVSYERRRSHRLAFILVWSVLLYFVFQHHVLAVGIITDRSMLPTLLEGNYFLVNKYCYHFGRPKRGDIVVLEQNRYTKEQYVKRVVGLPGDTLHIRQGAVYVNGRILDEPYIIGKTFPAVAPIILGWHEYYVLGDHRAYSLDSRQFGPVKLRSIEGRITPGKLFSF